jgi:cytochrome-b5 reductase
MDKSPEAELADEKPLPPAPAECCESGCELCVWDVYFEELRKWQERQAEQKQH